MRQMATGSMVGLFPVLMMVFLGLWWDTHSVGFFWSEEYVEESFKETVKMVKTHVDAYRTEYGHLPDSLCAEGLVLYWGDNTYADTTKWDRNEFIYQHWDDTAYSITSIGEWMKFVSSPRFEGLIVYRWDESRGSVRMEVTPVR